MNNKSQKSWGEIQLAIAAIAMTVTLALWNVFATPTKPVVAQAGNTETPPPPTDAPTQAASPTPGTLPVKIIFGGAPPQQRVIVQGAAPQAKPKHKGGGAGPAPAPTANTGSSKP